MPIIYLPAWGANRCRHSAPRGAAGDRVNDKPVYPGHPPAPHAPWTLVNPSSPAKSARRAWHALRPPFCCSPPGMKLGSDSPGQLMPFPYKPRSGRVINGDEPELSSGKEIRRHGCNQLQHHCATRQWSRDTRRREKFKPIYLNVTMEDIKANIEKYCNSVCMYSRRFHNINNVFDKFITFNTFPEIKKCNKAILWNFILNQVKTI